MFLHSASTLSYFRSPKLAAADAASFSQVDVWVELAQCAVMLLVTMVAFRTAASLKGGFFGPGMGLFAWGIAILALAQAAELALRRFGVPLPPAVLEISQLVLWITSWALFGGGFHQISRASRG